jgi:hypothetical protein
MKAFKIDDVHLALRGHPLFYGQAAIVTPDNPAFPGPKQGHEQFVADLKKLGLKHDLTVGTYGGQRNKSYIIHNATPEQAMGLAKDYGQESFIHCASGVPKMIYSSPDKEGTTIESNGIYCFDRKKHDGDNYTIVPGRGYLRFGFKF